ncbi:MAG: outer membrane lipoprotein carrier protein LolA [Deltaproteobacteria bacterium]|nr:outer membrane lipoprotein carrier protein LolA [Deltaproteobacteria bacterium]
MKLKYLALIFGMMATINADGMPGKELTTEPAPIDMLHTLDEVLDGVENRYLTTGFSARFSQTSTITAMDISDTASGKIYVKPPGMMRWEYESPDPQLIVSDGKTLWIYRPKDNQVIVGESPLFFGNGKGAGFLCDIKILRQKFEIFLEEPEDKTLYLLKLVPRENTLGLSAIYLFVSKQNFTLVRIITYNLYEDETRVNLSDIQFNPDLEDKLFTFTIPENTDIFQLDE